MGNQFVEEKQDICVNIGKMEKKTTMDGQSNKMISEEKIN
jgi:hypothetical protein